MWASPALASLTPAHFHALSIHFSPTPPWRYFPRPLTHCTGRTQAVKPLLDTRHLAKSWQRAYRSQPISYWIKRGLMALLAMFFTFQIASAMYYNMGAGGPKDISAYMAKIKHKPFLQKARMFLGGYGSYKNAQRYFESQKPLMEKSIRETTLHPYWARTPREVSTQTTWQDMVVGRMASMVRQLRTDARNDDFKVEKDKCEMYGFFARNQLPFVGLLGMWSDKQALVSFLHDTRSNIMLKQKSVRKYSWPLWLKSCHLTQGDDAGRIMLKKSDFTDADKFNTIVEWLASKWSQRPNDDARAWSDSARRLLGTLKPRFLIQESYAGPYGNAVGFSKRAPVELKVEVIWGRAYLANVCDYEAYILRDGTVERWDTSIFSRIAHVPVTDRAHNANVQWLLDEGHMERVFALAERVCQAMMADQVRVDIFVRPGDPDGAVVNEISISPGALYKWHAQPMASMWRRGHVTRSYTPYRLGADKKRVYELGPREGSLVTGEEWFREKKH